MVSSVSSSSSMPDAGRGAGFDDFGVAAPLGRQQLVGGQLLIDALRVDAGQVDLVEGHDDRHAGRPGMADRFFGLRHHAVVGGDDQHGDVGDVGAAGPHFGKGLVTGRVDEGDLAAVFFDLVGANVLGDAAALAAGHVDADDLVQQRGLAVVDVAQEGDDRRPGHQLAGIVLLGGRSAASCCSAKLDSWRKSTSTPISTASNSAVSGSMMALIVAMVPMRHQVL